MPVPRQRPTPSFTLSPAVGQFVAPMRKISLVQRLDFAPTNKVYDEVLAPTFQGTDVRGNPSYQKGKWGISGTV